MVRVMNDWDEEDFEGDDIEGNLGGHDTDPLGELAKIWEEEKGLLIHERDQSVEEFRTDGMALIAYMKAFMEEGLDPAQAFIMMREKQQLEMHERLQLRALGMKIEGM